MAKVSLKKAFKGQKNRKFRVGKDLLTVQEVINKGDKYVIDNGLTTYFDLEYSDKELKRMGIQVPEKKSKSSKKSEKGSSESSSGTGDSEEESKITEKKAELSQAKGLITRYSNILDKESEKEEGDRDPERIAEYSDKLDEAKKSVEKIETELNELTGKVND